MVATHLTLRRMLVVLLALATLWLCMALLSVCVGSTTYRPWQWWQAGADQQLAKDVILQLRLPRTLAALAVGGLLALAGTVQQVLLRNPKADPYVLGTAGAAGVGALLAMLLGAGAVIVSVSAGVGAFASILLVFLFAGYDRSAAQTRLLLTGVAVSSFCVALNALLLSLAPDGLLRGMVFWLLGDLSGADGAWPLAGLGVLLALIWPFARDLNLLGHGVQPAHALGLPIRRLRTGLYVLVAIATALAVTTAGMIGFVGLIVPHALRLMLGTDLRLLLPASALGGGIVLVLADMVGRMVLAPQQIPVGVITALVGVPVFLWLLRQRGMT
ncbi:FecCD family ABC transporter permease [Leeia oryzae]|uniref:FecCD family ABC transporter permease n=1 Tax=Leeia oryzae TaxID=356662 RepID=UPI000361B311|nr:iron ABC transporter permease [Leeia oryzae]